MPAGRATAAGGVRPDPGMEAARAILAATEEERQLHSFEIDASQVEHVKQRCLPGGLNYPMLEEYDFRSARASTAAAGMGPFIRREADIVKLAAGCAW